MTTTHSLDTDGFTLSAVEVIGAASQLFIVHVFAKTIKMFCEKKAVIVSDLQHDPF